MPILLASYPTRCSIKCMVQELTIASNKGFEYIAERPGKLGKLQGWRKMKEGNTSVLWVSHQVYCL